MSFPWRGKPFCYFDIVVPVRMCPPSLTPTTTTITITITITEMLSTLCELSRSWSAQEAHEMESLEEQRVEYLFVGALRGKS